MAAQHKMTKVVGRAISPGLVIGSTFIYHDRLVTHFGESEIREEQVEEELQRIEHALQTVTDDLRVSARRIEADTNARLAAIFEAHQAILHDPGLREEIRKLVMDEWMSAAHALDVVFQRRERKFRKMEEKSLYHRLADDVADLGRRLLRELAGVKTTPLEKVPPGRVLVARRLLPSDTVALPRGAVKGIVVEFGGPGSHAALLAEALGIPTVQISKVMEQITENDTLIVDGFRGEIVINPDIATQAAYTEEIQRAQARSTESIKLARQPARTKNGTLITVLANVGCREDVLAAVEDGADGIGLYRMEQFYLSRKTPPSAKELLAELQITFKPMKGKPVIVRLLDLGGDKPLPFLKLPPEDNPFLGQRGIRFLLRYPDLLDTQLRALWEFSREHDLRVLVPMVTLTSEIASVRERFAAVANGSKLPPLGAMIETPAAALSVAEMTAHADFFSIGTNDLTQYTMAAGRENPLVSDYFLEDHPAVLRLVGITVEEAGQTPVAICGELARQISVIPTLLKLGIRILSVAPPLVPGVKEAIAQTEV